jgi:hypothetical protein
VHGREYFDMTIRWRVLWANIIMFYICAVMTFVSAVRRGRLYPPGSIPGTHFCYVTDTLRSFHIPTHSIRMRNDRTNDTYSLLDGLHHVMMR